ncbi:MAG: hypothetical protein JXQ71_13975 [Verrucomicrobia bacterium]|nr:hypothetical protein [Verrucomicrobiota bacterium]
MKKIIRDKPGRPAGRPGPTVHRQRAPNAITASTVIKQRGRLNVAEVSQILLTCRPPVRLRTVPHRIGVGGTSMPGQEAGDWMETGDDVFDFI